jgi:gamma-glutamylcyclotransferase (GGCT)/AIG2-like uncharacterized protein YtfP
MLAAQGGRMATTEGLLKRIVSAIRARKEAAGTVGTTQVFVYGTLKRAYGNHRIAAPYVVNVEAGTAVGLKLHDGAFPAAGRARGRGVRGELLTIDVRGLEPMDRLEGVPRMYTRERVLVRMDDGRVVRAWVYLWARDLDLFGPEMPGETVEWSPQRDRLGYRLP